MDPDVVVDAVARRIHFAHDACRLVIGNQRLSLPFLLKAVACKEPVSWADIVIHSPDILTDVVVYQVELIVIEPVSTRLCACGQWQRAINESHGARIQESGYVAIRQCSAIMPHGR